MVPAADQPLGLVVPAGFRFRHGAGDPDLQGKIVGDPDETAAVFFHLVVDLVPAGGQRHDLLRGGGGQDQEQGQAQGKAAGSTSFHRRFLPFSQNIQQGI